MGKVSEGARVLASTLFHVGSLVVTQSDAWFAVLSFMVGLLLGIHAEKPRYGRRRE